MLQAALEVQGSELQEELREELKGATCSKWAIP